MSMEKKIQQNSPCVQFYRAQFPELHFSWQLGHRLEYQHLPKPVGESKDFRAFNGENKVKWRR